MICRRSIVEFELEGLDFENSIKILKKKNIPSFKHNEMYDKTSGNPLLLEIIDSSKMTKKYLSKEIFSKLIEEEQKTMEILSICRMPIPYDLFFIDDKVTPELIDNLVQKLIIKETSDEVYNAHELIKVFFYKRLSPNDKRRYNKLCGEYFIEQNNPEDHIEALYHFIKSREYQKVMDLTIKKAQDIINQGLSEKFLIVLEELTEVQVSLSQWVDILMLKGKLCFMIGYWDKSLQYHRQAVEISIKFGKKNIIAKAYCEIGYILEEQNLFNDSLKNFQKSLKISHEIKDNKKIAESKRGIGRYYWHKGDYKSAEKYFKDSLKALKNIKDFKLVGAIHIDLGNIYFEQYKTTRTIKYYERALKLLKNIDDKCEL